MDILRIVREVSPEEWVYNDFTTYVFTHHEHTSSEKIRFVNINGKKTKRRKRKGYLIHSYTMV